MTPNQADCVMKLIKNNKKKVINVPNVINKYYLLLFIIYIVTIWLNSIILFLGLFLWCKLKYIKCIGVSNSHTYTEASF